MYRYNMLIYMHARQKRKIAHASGSYIAPFVAIKRVVQPKYHSNVVRTLHIAHTYNSFQMKWTTRIELKRTMVVIVSKNA